MTSQESLVANEKLETTELRIGNIESRLGLSLRELHSFINVIYSFPYLYMPDDAKIHILGSRQSQDDRKLALQFSPEDSESRCTLMTIGLRRDSELIMQAIEPMPWMLEALCKVMELQKGNELKAGQFLNIELSGAFNDPWTHEKIGPSLCMLVAKPVNNDGIGDALTDMEGHDLNLLQLVRVDMAKVTAPKGQEAEFITSFFRRRMIAALVDEPRNSFRLF